MLICSSRRLSTRFLSACRELLVAMLHWMVPGKVLILFMDEEASNAVNRIFLVGKYPSSSYVSGPFIIFLSSLRLTERGNNFPGSPISKSNWRSNFEVSLFSGSPWLKLAFCWLWRASENNALSRQSVLNQHRHWIPFVDETLWLLHGPEMWLRIRIDFRLCHTGFLPFFVLCKRLWVWALLSRTRRKAILIHLALTCRPTC